MKAFIASLLFLALLGIRAPASFAQQDQSYQKLAQEMEALKEQILTLQSQLQTVENTEKMKLSAELADANAKLTDANAKLMNAKFGKFERELRDSNDGWLMKWNGFFIGVLAVIGVALWFSVKSLIANRVENELKGFQKAVAEVDVLKNQTKESISQVYILKNELKESIGQVNILENKIRVLDKAHAVDVLQNFMDWDLNDEDSYPKQMKELSAETLLNVLDDVTISGYVRIRALEVLTRSQEPRLVSPALAYLNSIVDSHQDNGLTLGTVSPLRNIVDMLKYMPTQEAYEGLTKFFSRLLSREHSGLEDLAITVTAGSLALISRELKEIDSVSLLRKAVPHLRVSPEYDEGLKDIVELFGSSNEREGIKEILNNHFKDDMGTPDVEDRCLKLLENHEPEFVKDWRQQKANTNTEPEETS